MIPGESASGVLRVTVGDCDLSGTVWFCDGGVLILIVFCALAVACDRACDMWEIPLCRGSHTHPVSLPVEPRRLPVNGVISNVVDTHFARLRRPGGQHCRACDLSVCNTHWSVSGHAFSPVSMNSINIYSDS